MAGITAEMVREATAHLPLAMEAPQRWQWLADFLNRALLHPTVPCMCCGVTPEGEVLDHLQPAQWAAFQPDATKRYPVQRIVSQQRPDMGMYTEIYVNVDLKTETPDDVIAVLRAICGGEDKTPLDGKPIRWLHLFTDGSHYTPRTSCANLVYCEIATGWSLLGKGDIKNHGGEIEAFFEWIMPWVDGFDGDFIGYKRYEGQDLPEMILLTNS